MTQHNPYSTYKATRQAKAQFGTKPITFVTKGGIIAAIIHWLLQPV